MLLKIAGEQDSPIALAAELTKIATDYKRLRDQATALNPTNPTAQALVAQANAAIDGGNFARAHEPCGRRRRRRRLRAYQQRASCA